MKIITYATSDQDVPSGMECIARFLIPTIDPKKMKKGVKEFHPVVIHASTLEEANQKAETWWNKELEKARAAQDAQLAAELKREQKKTAKAQQVVA